MNDSIEMNYYTPDTDTWAVSLDGRYIFCGTKLFGNRWDSDERG